MTAIGKICLWSLSLLAFAFTGLWLYAGWRIGRPELYVCFAVLVSASLILAVVANPLFGGKAFKRPAVRLLASAAMAIVVAISWFETLNYAAWSDRHYIEMEVGLHDKVGGISVSAQKVFPTGRELTSYSHTVRLLPAKVWPGNAGRVLTPSEMAARVDHDKEVDIEMDRSSYLMLRGSHAEGATEDVVLNLSPVAVSLVADTKAASQLARIEAALRGGKIVIRGAHMLETFPLKNQMIQDIGVDGAASPFAIVWIHADLPKGNIEEYNTSTESRPAVQRLSDELDHEPSVEVELYDGKGSLVLTQQYDTADLQAANRRLRVLADKVVHDDVGTPFSLVRDFTHQSSSSSF